LSQTAQEGKEMLQPGHLKLGGNVEKEMFLDNELSGWWLTGYIQMEENFNTREISVKSCQGLLNHEPHLRSLGMCSDSVREV
jgi:hypothetical protein